jgi:hypothetical protein
MGKPMSHRARVVPRYGALGVLIAALCAPAAARAARWEVTLAVRLADGTGGPVSLRVALPPNATAQQLTAIDVSARGFEAAIVRDGLYPHVLLTGRLRAARRLAVNFVVDLTSRALAVPPVWPTDQPPEALLPYLRPAPLFQSRSLLVREFLETNAAPLLEKGTMDPLRAIFTVTRERLTHASDGRSLALDVIRRGSGKRIGIERAFTTFLRCARMPARFVEGVRLSSTTSRKRMFWTEVWFDGVWWPVSASGGWVGNRPASALALVADGTRVVSVDGSASVSYSVRARREEKEQVR